MPALPRNVYWVYEAHSCPFMQTGADARDNLLLVRASEHASIAGYANRYAFLETEWSPLWLRTEPSHPGMPQTEYRISAPPVSRWRFALCPGYKRSVLPLTNPRAVTHYVQRQCGRHHKRSKGFVASTARNTRRHMLDGWRSRNRIRPEPGCKDGNRISVWRPQSEWTRSETSSPMAIRTNAGYRTRDRPQGWPLPVVDCHHPLWRPAYQPAPKRKRVCCRLRKIRSRVAGRLAGI